MKFFRGIGKMMKPFVNFPAWMGWKQISSTSKGLKDTAKTLLETPKPTYRETFQEATRRFHLSEADLQEKMKRFRQTALMYCAMAAGLFLYALYLFFTLHFIAAFLSLIVTVLALILAFRQHFWYFQMKRRKLGCTFKEWFQGTFFGGSKA